MPIIFFSGGTFSLRNWQTQRLAVCRRRPLLACRGLSYLSYLPTVEGPRHSSERSSKDRRHCPPPPPLPAHAHSTRQTNKTMKIFPIALQSLLMFPAGNDAGGGGGGGGDVAGAAMLAQLNAQQEDTRIKRALLQTAPPVITRAIWSDSSFTSLTRRRTICPPSIVNRWKSTIALTPESGSSSRGAAAARTLAKNFEATLSEASHPSSLLAMAQPTTALSGSTERGPSTTKPSATIW